MTKVGGTVSLLKKASIATDNTIGDVITKDESGNTSASGPYIDLHVISTTPSDYSQTDKTLTSLNSLIDTELKVDADITGAYNTIFAYIKTILSKSSAAYISDHGITDQKNTFFDIGFTISTICKALIPDGITKYQHTDYIYWTSIKTLLSMGINDARFRFPPKKLLYSDTVIRTRISSVLPPVSSDLNELKLIYDIIVYLIVLQTAALVEEIPCVDDKSLDMTEKFKLLNGD